MRRLGLILAVFLGLGAGLVLLAPRAAAFACPSCFGFEKIAPNIYAEPGAGDVLAMVQQARRRVAAYYPRVNRQPVLLICAKAACHARMGGGGARALTFGMWAIFVSPRGLDATFLAHELAHIEAHARIGLVGYLSGRVPAWFDEGLATIISRDARHVDASGRVAGCQDVGPTTLPVTLPASARAWRRQAGAGGGQSQYHDAACAVQSWLARHGGKGALDAVFANGLTPVSPPAP